MLKKMKNNKKGFTLVELIVVLVILAILAALLIPALTGYIDKAKRKSIVAETRQAVMAAQTLVDEKYGSVNVGTAITFGDGKDITYTAVEELAEVKGTVSNIVMNAADDATTDASHPAGTVVQTLTYITSDGKVCVYTKGATSGTDGEYNVTKQK